MSFIKMVKLAFLRLKTYRWAGFREHKPFAKTQNRHPWQAQRGPSLARDALLQVYAPFASRPATASGFRKVATNKLWAGWILQQRKSLTRREPGQKRKASRARDGAGRACHGWRFLRLSDLTRFPAQAQSDSGPNQILQMKLKGPHWPWGY